MAKPLSWPQDRPTIVTVSDRAGMLRSGRDSLPADFVRLTSALAVRVPAAQIGPIWTALSASQVVERGERAVDDLGAWQRTGQRGDLVEDVGARLLADLLLELPVTLYILAGYGGR